MDKIRNFLKGVRAEYNKIIWLNREEVVKQLGATILVSLVLGGIIALLDYAFQMALGLIL